MAALAVGGRVEAQELLTTPQFGEVGQEVEVRLVSRDGSPIGGVGIEALSPGGDEVRIGATDGDGTVRFTPEVAGRYELRALIRGGRLLLISPYEVRPERDRALWAMACVPVGLLLLWFNLSRRRTAARP